jgi:paraquat-inducible protein B
MKVDSSLLKFIQLTFDFVRKANLMIEPNSVMNSELNKLLQQSNGAARALRILADYLERHPEALIYGKKGEVK